MKKLVLTTLIGAALGFATQSAFADDSTPPEGATGLLTVKGKVVDTTCTVKGTKGPNIIRNKWTKYYCDIAYCTDFNVN
ncbi:hypothetical protein [Avibacterium paragallinarum]|uniref:hypothetical protein n=1 Tax=Avibacterium paragallinarum TaxID=728 RepID=UPI0003784C40|nr:hypothetical protein [Avibacterium paragallinarum]